MKKLELKFAAQKMTKEQMKKVRGGKPCTAHVECFNPDAGYQEWDLQPNVDCSAADAWCQNANLDGSLFWYSTDCYCED